MPEVDDEAATAIEATPDSSPSIPAPPHRPATMQDVAEAAGVSNMTVSNVLNGRDARVGNATRERVLRAISELDYRVNVSARTLRRGRTGVVVLAVPHLGSLYYGELADRLVHRFAHLGLRLVVERTGEGLEEELAALAVSHLDAYDGLVLMVTQGESEDLERISPSKPVVLIGERALSRRYDHVLMDNVQGAELATRRLIDTGSTRIVLLGGATDHHESMPGLRTKGYLAAHAASGVTVDERLIVPARFGSGDGYSAVHALVRDGVDFDGVFALTDDSAIGALAALTEAGRSVPRDVQVIGWDDVSWGRYTVPALSTVSPANDEIADAIVRILLARIKGDEGARHTVMPPASLILRGSTR